MAAASIGSEGSGMRVASKQHRRQRNISERHQLVAALMIISAKISIRNRSQPAPSRRAARIINT